VELELEAFTSDNVEIKVNSIVQIKVEDSEKAIFEVTNVLSAIQIFASSAIRTVIGKLSFEDLNSSKDAIKIAVMKDLKKPLKGWGIKLNGVEIMKLKCLDKRVNQCMKLQNEAEQNQKQTEKNADADKLVRENRAKADRYEREKEADGQAR